VPQQHRLAITFNAFVRRIEDARFELLTDRRKAKGKRYPHIALLSALSLGLLADCRSLRDVEHLTSKLSRKVRRRCQIPHRISDTTLGATARQLKEWQVRRALHRQVKVEYRRGNLKPVGFPMGIVAIDGKNLAKTDSWEHRNIQKCHQQKHDPYGLARAHRSFLVSSQACVCIDQKPIPGKTNELGTILMTVQDLHQVYGRSGLIGAFIADAGNSSPTVASWADAQNYGYILAIKTPQGEVTRDALFQLTNVEVEGETNERTDGALVTHRLRRVQINQNSPWSDARQYVEVERTTVNLSTNERTTGRRLYVSNIPFKTLTSTQWLKAIRAYWRCENEGHGTADREWSEDTKRTPWTKDPETIFALGALRMLALNILAVLRVQCRAPQLGESRLSWKQCILDAYVALVATPERADA